MVIVENNVWSAEHSKQLEAYRRLITHTHPVWTILCVYLTPLDNAPTHEEYVPLDYGEVCAVVDEVLQEPGCALTPEVRMTAEHYARMVRRNLLGDPEVVKLAQEIYRKHRRAMDLVYANRPDVRGQLGPVIKDLVEQEPGLELDRTDKGNIRFAVRDWDTPAVLSSTGWTPRGAYCRKSPKVGGPAERREVRWLLGRLCLEGRHLPVRGGQAAVPVLQGRDERQPAAVAEGCSGRR